MLFHVVHYTTTLWHLASVVYVLEPESIGADCVIILPYVVITYYHCILV